MLQRKSLLVCLALVLVFGCSVWERTVLTQVHAQGQTTVAPQNQDDLLHYQTPLTELISDSPVRKSQIALRVEKSKYRLTVLYRGKAVKSYPVVLGGNPVDDKRREGDSCTPEGYFHLSLVRPHQDWTKFMLLDYPTAVSWQRFRTAKRDGTIPKNATIGGAVGIHGVPDHADAAIDRRQNWTAGCISLKTHDIEEVASVCQKGTLVHILH